MVDAGLGNGAALDPGYRVWLDLFVLDEPTLSALAEIADPSEVCASRAKTPTTTSLQARRSWRGLGGDGSPRLGSRPTPNLV
jgi:hypothetical protein